MDENTPKLARWLRSMFAGWQMPTSRPVDDKGEGAESLIGFVLAAAVVGALTGLAAASFRIALTQLSAWRTALSGWAHGSGWGLMVVVLTCVAAVTAAAALVRRLEPQAEGSGIPHVEAIVAGRAAPGRFRILPVKYLGGLLSMGGGLALGREGPSVQMGGSIAVIVASVTRRPTPREHLVGCSPRCLSSAPIPDCLVGLAAEHLNPQNAPEPAALALISMAAFFTASVQAPVTGLILATELTGTTNQLPPMLGACASALLVAVALGSRPIYDLLTDRAAAAAVARGNSPSTHQPDLWRWHQRR